MFGIGFPELILLLAIALIALGPEKLPQIARLLGKSLHEIRKAAEEVRASVEKEVDEAGKKAPEAEEGGVKEGEKRGGG